MHPQSISSKMERIIVRVDYGNADHKNCTPKINSVPIHIESKINGGTLVKHIGCIPKLDLIPILLGYKEET